jgi:hypothetical protein
MVAIKCRLVYSNLTLGDACLLLTVETMVSPGRPLSP